MASAGSLTSARRRSESPTPPGSRSTTTRSPRRVRASSRPATSVVLPAPAIPSTVMSTAGEPRCSGRDALPVDDLLAQGGDAGEDRRHVLRARAEALERADEVLRHAVEGLLADAQARVGGGHVAAGVDVGAAERGGDERA